jgi:hypothetical protein
MSIDEDFPDATVDIEVTAGVLEGSYTIDLGVFQTSWEDGGVGGGGAPPPPPPPPPPLYN